jgi:hypothetical protein
MSTEEWRKVVGWEGIYEISSLGRVRRVAPCAGTRAGRILSAPTTTKGYSRLTLGANGIRQKYHVHTLVAAAFLGPCPDGYQVNHCNGNKTDNRIGNLQYVTPSQNVRHSFDVLNRSRARGERAGAAKLCEEQVREIKKLCKAGYERKEVARMYGVSITAVRCIVAGMTWRHVK